MTIPRIQRDLLARGPEKAHNLNYAYQGASGNGSGNRSYAYYRDMLPAPKVCPCVVSGPTCVGVFSHICRCVGVCMQGLWKKVPRMPVAVSLSSPLGLVCRVALDR